ncbi:hypothetical protein C6W92_08440 [Roseovarius sp. A46]|uniref:DUF2306 domain-containing protein n=1 Tax=Roseovarius sp. A46 TaxID=2109331 RepID=UPI0010127AC7|nr:DUF2306 domain-containing protein [Roseovarius sp. A46]RXV64087.1 hypothetical protein C6W92_08440 [Roseovarius sp. A46]
MTSFDPLFNAPLAIQVHVAGAVVAVLLTPVALWRRRRDRLHKVTGYGWVLGMAVAALSSFAITEFGVVGPFSPIHALSVATLAGLFVGVRAAIRGDTRRHRASMTQLSLALVVAGMFTLAPGRIVHRMVMGGTGWAGFGVVALAVAAALWLRRHRRHGGAARA